MAEGHLHEEAIKARLREQGWLISREEEDIFKHILSVEVGGHIDGVIQWAGPWNGSVIPKDPPLVLENKTMSDETFKQWKRTAWDTPGLIQKYKWQTSIYMGILNMPMMFVAKNRNTGEIDTDFVREPFYSWSYIVNRVMEIEIAAKNNDLPETCNPAMFPCPFDFLHDDEDDIELIEATSDLGLAIATFLVDREKRDILIQSCKDGSAKITELMGLKKKVGLPFATATIGERGLVIRKVKTD